MILLTLSNGCLHCFVSLEVTIFFNEIKALSSSINVELKHIGWMANGLADSLAK